MVTQSLRYLIMTFVLQSCERSHIRYHLASSSFLIRPSCLNVLFFLSQQAFFSNLTMSSLTPQLVKRLAHTLHNHYTKTLAHLTTIFAHANIQPKAALYASLLFLTCVWLLFTTTRHLRRRRSNSQPSTPNLEKRSPFKVPERAFGGKISPRPRSRIAPSPFS
jgi:hypothetical protein